MDAFEAHAREILVGLRPQHLPEADKEVLQEWVARTPTPSLPSWYFEHAHIDSAESTCIMRYPHSSGYTRWKNGWTGRKKEFDQLKKLEPGQLTQKTAKKSRRWFKGLGQIGQGAALSIANVALAIGVIRFPVSPETQTWGALTSVATGIGTVLNGVGNLRSE